MKTDEYIKNTIKPHFEGKNNISFEYITNSIYFEMDPDKNLIIHLPHKLFAEWFDLHIRQELEDCIYKILTQINTINYRVKKNKNKFLQNFKYDSQYKFENFLYNNNNYLSCMSIFEFAQSDYTSLNSALITGKKGCGKTHLLKAIANYKLENQPENKILYLTLDNLHTLYNHKYKKNKDLISWMHLFDTILLDDLQQIDTYPDLQKDLISIFDYFYEQERPIVFACRGNPHEMELLGNQLRSRLESGLIATLKEPDLDIKIKYLQEQNLQKKLDLNQNHILYLAGNLENFKNLYAAVVKLLAHKDLKSNPVDENVLKEIISEQSNRNQNNFQELITIVSEYFGYSHEEIKSKNRQQKIVLARQVGMFLCRELLGYSYLKIGQLFGDRDHSTVIHSIKKIQQLQEVDTDVKFMLKDLKITCRKSIT